MGGGEKSVNPTKTQVSGPTDGRHYLETPLVLQILSRFSRRGGGTFSEKVIKGGYRKIFTKVKSEKV